MAITTITLYKRNDTHTVNGENAFKLLTSRSTGDSGYSWVYITGGTLPAKFNVDIIKRASGGSETVLGSAVAQTTRNTNPSEGIQSATWSCPETALLTTDAIKVIWRSSDNSGVYATTSNSITEQVASWTGDSKTPLVGATWTIFKYTGLWTPPDEEIEIFTKFGKEAWDTRIEGVQYGQAAQTISPSGIASAETFGAPSLVLVVAPGGIASAEAFGAAKLLLKINPGGIASAEMFGSPTLTPIAILQAARRKLVVDTARRKIYTA